jgi:hypothetical protein
MHTSVLFVQPAEQSDVLAFARSPGVEGVVEIERWTARKREQMGMTFTLDT